MNGIGKNKLAGEQKYAKKIIQVIPLIEKYFKDFEGERILLASGNFSAKFEKIKKAFYEEVAEIEEKGFRCIVSNSRTSVYTKADASLSNPSGSTSYYGGDNYFGKIDNDGYFTYDFNEAEDIADAQAILDISEYEIDVKAKEIEALRSRIVSIESSVPYCIKELIK